MSGILPNNGVGPGQTQNGIADPDLAGACQNLYYGPRCNPRLDPFAMNALISEIINALNSIGISYDCTRLDNLATAFLTLQGDPPVLPNGAPSAILQHRTGSGVNGGSTVQNVWRARTLNNKPYDPGLLVNLAANSFTVAANCYCSWLATFVETDKSKTRLWNVTDGVVVEVGTTITAQTIGGEQDGTWVSEGQAFLAAGKTYQLQIWSLLAAGSDPTEALGRASNAGVDELYAIVNFWRT